MFACRCFTAEHEAVSSFVNCIGHVADFSPRGYRGVNHRLKQVSSDDDGLASRLAGPNGPSLNDGELFEGAFDSQITPGYHQGIGCRNDFVQVAYSLLVFDFGNDLRV